jgi:hypothetical protein
MIWWGKRTEALRASRKNRNRQPQEIGGWGTLQNALETWEVTDFQYSKGRILDEMPDSRERELTEPTSSRKTGHQMRDGVAIPQSHLWPIIVSVWKNYRDGNGEEPEEKKVQWQALCGIQLKGRSQGLTLLLRLWNTHKEGLIVTVLLKTQKAAERVRCIYLHPTNGQKLLTPSSTTQWYSIPDSLAITKIVGTNQVQTKVKCHCSLS